MISLKTIMGLESIIVNNVYNLTQKTYTDWMNLQKSAKKENIMIEIISAHRNFDTQKKIWNEKFQGKRKCYDRNSNQVDISNYSEKNKVNTILNWSAVPGLSRHHLGTDLDVYQYSSNNKKVNLQPYEYLQQNGQYYHMNQWLEKNIKCFNFFKPYKYDYQGIAIEPWHLSHITSQEYNNIIKNNKDKILAILTEQNILGIQTIKDEFYNILDKYVFNISSPEL